MIRSILALILLLGSAGFAHAESRANEPVNPTRQKWTYIRIVDYDSVWENSGPTLDEALQHLPAETPNNVNFVLLADGYKTAQSAYAYVTPTTARGGASREILRIDKQAMNSVESYRKFFEWATRNFPAEHFVLSFWGHGGGPAFSIGALGYASSFGDTGLTPRQFGDVMRDLSSRIHDKISVAFLCTCLNGGLENAFEIRDTAQYFVAGETSVGCALEPFNILQTRTDLSSKALAQQTVQHFGEGVGDFPGDIVYSAVDLAKIAPLAADVGQFGKALSRYGSATEANRKRILDLAATADNMDLAISPHSIFASYVDLYDLADKLAGGIQDSEIRTLANTIKSSIKNDVVVALSSYHDRGQNLYTHSQGIYVVHPSSIYNSYLDISYYKSHSFSQSTGWGEYIEILLSGNPKTHGEWEIQRLFQIQPSTTPARIP